MIDMLARAKFCRTINRMKFMLKDHMLPQAWQDERADKKYSAAVQHGVKIKIFYFKS
jgi:hypothetical protein